MIVSFNGLDLNVWNKLTIVNVNGQLNPSHTIPGADAQVFTS